MATVENRTSPECHRPRAMAIKDGSGVSKVGLIGGSGDPLVMKFQIL